MELRHLRYVLAAADTGSIRAAARALGIEPSAVSRRIRDLEDEIGAALFIRKHCGVVPTFAGERFLHKARSAITNIEHATADVGMAGRAEAGVVRIGLISSMATGFLAELFQSYEAERSGVHLAYVEGGPSDHVPAVRRHQLDVAFLTGTPTADGCEVSPLWHERVFVVMSQFDPLAEKEEIAWRDLRDRHFVVSEAQPGGEIFDYLVKHLAELGHHPHISRQAVYRDMLIQSIASSRSLTLTSEATTGIQFPGVVHRPLAGEILPFCAVWSPTNDNPAFRRLMSLARVLSRRCPKLRVLASSTDRVSPCGLSQSRDRSR